MNGNSKLKPALIGGGALGFVSAVPILNLANCACCALVIGGGVLAAYLYLKEAPPAAPPPLGDGVVLGLMTGVAGAVVGAVVSIPFSLLPIGLGMMGGLEDVIDNADLPAPLAEILAAIGSGGFAMGAIFVGFIINLVLYSIFATIGSLIGIAIFNKKAS